MIKLFMVGGAVRDKLMGLQPHDIDFAVETSSYEEMRDWMISEKFTIWQERPEFLTIRAKFPDGWEFDNQDLSRLSADFVVCRKEGFYSDGRHPDDVSVGTIFDDLARRDFTINAIAINVETNETLDPHGGEQDIMWKTLRCVGTPQERFTEDGLRVIRAIRFMITKDFNPHITLLDALESDWVAPLVAAVNTNQRRQELVKSFEHDTVLALKFLSRWPHLHEAIFSDGLWLKPSQSDHA